MTMPGRTAGRVTTLVALVALVGGGAPAGCTSTTEAPMKVTGVFPDSAFSDAPFSVTVSGTNFRPAYRVDTASGSGSVDPDAYSAFLIPIPNHPSEGLVSVPATKVTWTSTGLPSGAGILKVELPAHITVAVYDLAVRNPHGEIAVMPRAFRSMGTDSTPPSVSIDDPAPDTVVGAGSGVSVHLSADDGQGVLASLHLEVTGPGGSVASLDCSVPLSTQRTNCPLAFFVPEAVSELDVLRLQATAIDHNGNHGEAVVYLVLAPRPTLVDVLPNIGPASGNTPITVTGLNFVPGQANNPGTQVFIDGRRLAMMAVTPTQITAMTFPHDEGDGIVSVRTGGSTMVETGVTFKFTFVPQPIVRLLAPSEGPEEGGVPVRIVGNGFREDTTISFGARYVINKHYVNANRIDGILPPGAGTVDITAYDPIGGQSLGLIPFKYLAPDDPDAGPTTPDDPLGGPS